MHELELLATSTDRIVLICHSMGGLVGKLAVSSLRAASIALPISLVTLGTPHCGVASAVLPVASRSLRNQQLKDTTALSESLRRISLKWDSVQHQVPHLFLHGAFDDVVPPKSAQPASSRTRSVVVAQDHASIARPGTSSSDVIRHIRGFLHQLEWTVDWTVASDENLKTVVADLWLADSDSAGIPAVIQVERQGLGRHIGLADGDDPTSLLVVTDQVPSEGDLVDFLTRVNRGKRRIRLWSPDELQSRVWKRPALAIELGMMKRTPSSFRLEAGTVAPDLPRLSRREFLNREHEREEVKRTLRSGGAPLLVLVGPAGVGKSTLAARAIESALREGYAPRALRLTTSTTRQHILEFLELSFQAVGDKSFEKVFRDSRSAESERLTIALRVMSRSKLLLVFDSLEALMKEDRQVTLPLLRELLVAASNKNEIHSRVLVTSRALPDWASPLKMVRLV